MEPPVYVVASHEEDGLLFELCVFKDDAEIVQEGLSATFWPQPRVRVTKAGSLKNKADALRVRNEADATVVE